MSQRRYRENQSTPCIKYLCFRKSCQLWDNVGKYGTAGLSTDGNIIWCSALHRGYIRPQTHTHN